ncbi:MAG TPA: hypothetical protein VFF40_14425 [Acidimicrobiia bacterium]|nr:hypothetical protein [Acidimicrobiia bacterium]
MSDAARLVRWEGRAQPFIILAALVPILGTIGAGPPTLRSWGVELVCWGIFAVDLAVHLRFNHHYLRTPNGVVDLLIVVLTFPWSIVIGDQRATLTTVLRFARLGRIARAADDAAPVDATAEELTALRSDVRELGDLVRKTLRPPEDDASRAP